MTDRDIIHNLRSLRSIAPSAEWKAGNRETLVAQINAGRTDLETEKGGVWEKLVLPWQIVKYMPQATLAAVGILFLFLSGGVLSVRAAKDSKPGDSLYVAKILNERTHLALTFDEEKRARLGLAFANNRAEELNRVLNEPAANSDKDEQVARLKKDYKKEIAAAKGIIAKISQDRGATPSKAHKEVPITTPQQSAGPEAARPAEAEPAALEDGQVFSADVGREEQGISVSGNDTAGEAETAPLAAEAEPAASTTPEAAATGTAAKDPSSILEEASDLLSKQDYQATLEALDQAGVLIDDVKAGEVKGESEAAPSVSTTTPDVEQGTEKATSTR